MENIELKLNRLLSFRHCPLVGCARQHRLAPLTGWKFARGNALLAYLGGNKVSVGTPAGDFDVYLYWGAVMSFRGGPFKEWWREDMLMLQAVVTKWGPEAPGPYEGLLVQELDNRPVLHYFDAPSLEEAERLSQSALSAWKKQERIRKNTQRAYAVCPHCPARMECLALDLERGETGDWPTQTFHERKQ